MTLKWAWSRFPPARFSTVKAQLMYTFPTQLQQDPNVIQHTVKNAV